MIVQCKGSGRNINAGFNATRATCPVCGNAKDLTGAGRIKKHMRVVTAKQLRSMK